MRIACLILTASLTLQAGSIGSILGRNKHPADEWKTIFDGKTLEGWLASGNANAWSVKDGAIRGEGGGTLFYKPVKCVNCEFKADVRIQQGSSAAMLVRGVEGAGYQALINNTGSGDARTGGLVGFVKMPGQWVIDDQWFTLDVLVEGNHVAVYLNGRSTADFIDEKNTYFSGSVGFTDQTGVVEFRNVEMRTLPGPTELLAGLWKSDKLEIRIQEERDGLRYQSGNVNYWARLDGLDYLLTGSPAEDHVRLYETTHHRNIHKGLKAARIRKKPEDHFFAVETKLGPKIVSEAVYRVSADGKTLTIEGQEKQVLEKSE